jgi:hypothetical protein
MSCANIYDASNCPPTPPGMDYIEWLQTDANPWVRAKRAETARRMAQQESTFAAYKTILAEAPDDDPCLALTHLSPEARQLFHTANPTDAQWQELERVYAIASNLVLHGQCGLQESAALPVYEVLRRKFNARNKPANWLSVLWAKWSM